jgi:5-(carboxyamino)imidazole ribonucleotide mutase
MPTGVPVATVAINGGANAGILAVKMLAMTDAALAAKLHDFIVDQKEQVESKDSKLQSEGYKAFL